MTSVSVVMSVGNRPNHLRNTLKSWSLVDYPDFDFTVIDNYSKNPETEGVVMEFKDRLPITFHRIDSWTNVNVVWNRYGRASQGEYVIFAMMDEIISSKSIIHKMIEYEDHRCSVFTYFMSEAETNNLNNIDWESDPTIIPKPFTTDTAAGLISHIHGNYRKNWDWFGWFRDDQNGHLWLDQDVYLRERALGTWCRTVEDVYCLHQYHKLAAYPQNYTQPGYTYHTEAQARLLEPAPRDEA